MVCGGANSPSFQRSRIQIYGISALISYINGFVFNKLHRRSILPPCKLHKLLPFQVMKTLVKVS